MNGMAIITVNGEPQTIQHETITVAELLTLNKVEMLQVIQCCGSRLALRTSKTLSKTWSEG
jgi:hypothetical protein